MKVWQKLRQLFLNEKAKRKKEIQQAKFGNLQSGVAREIQHLLLECRCAGGPFAAYQDGIWFHYQKTNGQGYTCRVILDYKYLEQKFETVAEATKFILNRFLKQMQNRNHRRRSYVCIQI